MAITRLKPNGVNNSSTFTFAGVTSTGLVTATGGVKVGNIQDTSGTNTISLSSGAVSMIGNLTIGTAGSGNFAATNIAVSGLTSIQQATETVRTKTGATGTVVHDFSTGALFYHSSVAANFTPNFTNVPTTDDRLTVVALVVAQGSTPYLPTAVQIDGSAQTINWIGATTPTGTANRKEVATFSLLRTGAAWTVFGTFASFG